MGVRTRHRVPGCRTGGGGIREEPAYRVAPASGDEAAAMSSWAATTGRSATPGSV